MAGCKIKLRFQDISGDIDTALSSVFLLFSDQKILYLCTLAKLCSLKVQIKKGIDCSFPQDQSSSVISELNI